MFDFDTNTIKNPTEEVLREFLKYDQKGHTVLENVCAIAAKIKEMKFVFRVIEGKLSSRINDRGTDVLYLIRGIQSDIRQAEKGFDAEIPYDLPYYSMKEWPEDRTATINKVIRDFLYMKDDIITAFFSHIEEVCKMYLSNVYGEGSYYRVPAIVTGRKENGDEVRFKFTSQILSVFDFYDQKLYSLNDFAI